MSVQKAKYENAVLYLCKKLGGEVQGKVKLAKLLYFVDFDYYEKHQASITGDTYHALPMGPVPDAMNEIVDGLVSGSKVERRAVNQFGDAYAPTEIYKALAEPDLSVFGADELKMLDRVAKRYGGLNGKQLQDLTHAEAPFTAAELSQEVPYEFTYYRGTDFSDLCRVPLHVLPYR